MSVRFRRHSPWAAAVGLAAYVILEAACASTPPVRAPRGVAVLEEVTLGGARQWVLIRGRDASHPLLLFLHGGPGMPAMPFEHALRGLEERFTVVMWDQRGAGKSFHEGIPPDTMTIERFVSDAAELVRLLLDRFHQEKLYLVGHSWGSILGVRLAQAHPEWLYAYVGVGQVAVMTENERLSYEFTVRRAHETDNKRALDELAGVTPPYRGRLEELFTQRKWLETFGGVLYGKTSHDALIGAALGSSEYTLGDLLNIDRGYRFTIGCLWDQMLTVDLPRQAPRLEVPVYFFLGRHDYNTPFVLAQKYYETLQAPRKRLIWFERSAHVIILEEPRKFIASLVSPVLEETYPAAP